ncbi:hypothetical protein F0562_033306 [Nyssa sinensis]|uniref:INNER NO OUTER n=1 Tax=Nyssa sinensis TaxID=561372 RepID=A0A5J5AVX1_9ASTE|nr:hypothetical protein F0562_033306 [Nyssa sinensis]
MLFSPSEGCDCNLAISLKPSQMNCLNIDSSQFINENSPPLAKIKKIKLKELNIYDSLLVFTDLYKFPFLSETLYPQWPLSLSLSLKMSALNHLFDLQEQICYVQCGYCTTILLVSVPCSSLSMVVTVRCGHCTSLLSVNMTKASFVPLQLFASLNQDEPKTEACPEEADAKEPLDKHSPSLIISSDDEEEDEIPVNHVVNKPPEKRQRAPSAYNNFINREEIRRLKAKYPNMTHKEAFSAAAKNWAHFPPIQYKREGESYAQGGRKMPRSSDVEEVHVEGNSFP